MKLFNFSTIRSLNPIYTCTDKSFTNVRILAKFREKLYIYQFIFILEGDELSFIRKALQYKIIIIRQKYTQSHILIKIVLISLSLLMIQNNITNDENNICQNNYQLKTDNFLE